MHAITDAPPTTPKPAVQWPLPIINDPDLALEDAGCLLERLHSLLTSCCNDLHDVIHADGYPEHLQRRSYSVWMNFVTASEKADEIEGLISAIIAAQDVSPTSSVGKHTELRRSLDWAEAAAAYNAAQAAPVIRGSIDEAFKAFHRLINTRAPNLRCLHEKMMIIDKGGDWSINGLADSLLADVEALARKIEIPACPADRAEG